MATMVMMPVLPMQVFGHRALLPALVRTFWSMHVFVMRVSFELVKVFATLRVIVAIMIVVNMISVDLCSVRAVFSMNVRMIMVGGLVHESGRKNPK